MISKRIIACLDIKNGRTVKGVQFQNMVDAGDPIELAFYYSENGIDELVFLDISASIEERKTFTELVSKIADTISIPFTVGGGVATSEDVKRLLDAGADKVAMNSSAVKNPYIIDESASIYGSQCIVLAVDVKLTSRGYEVFTHGGTRPTTLEAQNWIDSAIARGAGEILLTSMDKDGTNSGFDLPLYQYLEGLRVPLIASGGAGKKEDFAELFKKTDASAGLIAGKLHRREITIYEIKKYLISQGERIRC